MTVVKHKIDIVGEFGGFGHHNRPSRGPADAFPAAPNIDYFARYPPGPDLKQAAMA